MDRGGNGLEYKPAINCWLPRQTSPQISLYDNPTELTLNDIDTYVLYLYTGVYYTHIFTNLILYSNMVEYQKGLIYSCR